jgi:serine/threonine protein kinase
LAPELVKGNEYFDELKSNADVFSLGVLFYELLFRKPFYDPKIITGRITNEEVDLEAK